jgi:PAS domain S-box-containing protein
VAARASAPAAGPLTATDAAVHEMEARYRALTDDAEDSIFIVSDDARIEYANSASAHRFGMRSEDIVGKRLSDVFPVNVAEEMWREVSSVFTTGVRQYVEHRFAAPSGDLWLGTWLVPISREASGRAAVMGAARDITDRKRLEREFAQSQKLEAVGRLAGGIAHDFNNLLTAIIGYADLILENVRHDANLTADVIEIKAAGERAGRLTRQLLTFSRKQQFSPTVLDLNQIVLELRNMLDRIIGEDIALGIVIDPQLAPTKADASLIEQLVVNLVVNARDAMPRGGTIRIKTFNAELDAAFVSTHDGAVAGSYVAVAVQDTGCGMTADVLAHAFEPFFTTKPAGKGTGLGLSTVYGIVKQSGGAITIDSRPGAGTTVTTYFPVVDPAADATAKQSHRTAPLSGTETILVVEDEPRLRRLVQRALHQYGYTVLDAETVDHAISLAERHAGVIDLLLSDVIMPGLSGPDLAQRVVRLRPSIKVLYMSGFTSAGAVGGSISRRTCFLPKPFTTHGLAQKVRECLDCAVPPGTVTND